MHVTFAAALLLTLSTTLAQQQTRTAYPIDNDASSTGQNIPIAGGSTSFDEARSHFYFPAAFLPPAAGLITGIEFASARAGTTPYERFEISFDHTSNPGLSSTFANNLTAPQLVYQQTPGSIAWNAGTWTQLNFATPFGYDGTSNLVMEVVKVLDRPNNPTIPSVSMRILTWPRRTDLPTPRWQYGAYGSGAANSTAARTTYSTQLLVRLLWQATPTLVIDSTRDTTSSSNRSYYHLGATATTTVQGVPGQTFLQAIGVDLFPAGVPIAGAVGELWLSGGVLLGVGVLDAAGLGALNTVMPNNPNLVGVNVYWQGGTLAGAPQLTNVVKAIIAL